jgi:arylsulfatase A-like enzyme
MSRTEHLVDFLAEAAIESAGPGHVQVQRVCIRRDARTALFQHPPSRVLFPPIRLGRSPRLRIAAGVKPPAWNDVQNEIVFEAEANGRVLFRVALFPRERPADREWRDLVVDLAPFERSNLRLELRVSVPTDGSTAHAWSAWGDPRIEHHPEIAPVPRRRDDRTHVFLITADALGSDRLAEARTPHLDRFADDACTAAHARSQSPATIGSYASLLTGLHVPEHGLSAEWGTLPALPTIPGALRKAGYHAAMLSSELDLAQEEHGFAALFDESLPCLANPAQDGSVTARQFERWLDRRPDRPCFAWLQFFDTHPPALPPEPYRSLYYAGDPADPARRHRPEDVAAINGVESSAMVGQALSLMEGGRTDHAMAVRLRDTARALRGEIRSAPDLACHLRALGPGWMRGLPAAEFGAWLAPRAARLFDGSIDAALLEWLRSVRPALGKIESEILAWLDGVVDFRFPLAMHLASISALDAHVGAMLDALRARGLYERSVVVFTSPHGEIFGTHGIVLHHHVLFESVLRVPLMIKGPGIGGGRRLDGAFDLIDVFPTLMEMMGAAAPRVSGVSRCGELRGGRGIAPHASAAVSNHEVMTGWREGDWTFLRAERPHEVSDSWSFRGGERMLFDLRDTVPELTNRAAERPEVAAELERRMDAWKAGLVRLAPAQTS